jgi:hypothetical protein
MSTQPFFLLQRQSRTTVTESLISLFVHENEKSLRVHPSSRAEEKRNKSGNNYKVKHFNTFSNAFGEIQREEKKV